MRLIDTDALIEALDSFILDEVTDVHGDTVREILERLPTIEERKTGEWLHDLLQDAIDANEITETQAIGIMWRAQHKGAKEIRELTGLSRAAFCRLYGIPLRTMENYEAGTREAPAWVLALLERVVKADTENEGGKD